MKKIPSESSYVEVSGDFFGPEQFGGPGGEDTTGLRKVRFLSSGVEGWVNQGPWFMAHFCHQLVQSPDPIISL